jgi:hypothetical protein
MALPVVSIDQDFLLCKFHHYAVPAIMYSYNSITENPTVFFSLIIAALNTLRSNRQEVFTHQSLMCCEILYFLYLSQTCDFEVSYDLRKLLSPQSVEEGARDLGFTER